MIAPRRMGWIEGFRAFWEKDAQGITPAERACLELLDRVERLEKEVAELKGKMDEKWSVSMHEEAER